MTPHPARGETWAAIDCGTNTALLTLALVDADGTLTPQQERAEVTRLGAGLAQRGLLDEPGLARTEEVVRGYVAEIARAGCSRVFAVGTEALRRATNGPAAAARLDAALDPLGAHLEVIEGAREAQLVFRATCGSFPALAGPRTVIDIGGGSTEIVVGDEHTHAGVSLPIGSVVLTEAHLRGDPPTPDERAALGRAIDDALAGAPPLHGPVVGIAATVTTYAAIAAGLAAHDGARVHGGTLARAALEAQVARFAGMTIAERRATPCVDGGRADFVYAGGEILARLLARAQVSTCLVSDRGVRWGLLYEALVAR